MDFWFRAWTGEAAQNAETPCEHPDWLSGLRGRGHPGNFWYQDSKSTCALPSAGIHARCFPPWLATLCHTFKPSQVPPRPPRALLILELFFLWFILLLHKDFLHIMRQSIPKFTCYSPYSPVSGTALRPKAILRSSWKKKKKKDEWMSPKLLSILAAWGLCCSEGAALPRGIYHLRSPTRDGTRISHIGRQVLYP